jgi:hypothetical protein
MRPNCVPRDWLGIKEIIVICGKPFKPILDYRAAESGNRSAGRGVPFRDPAPEDSLGAAKLELGRGGTRMYTEKSRVGIFVL